MRSRIHSLWLLVDHCVLRNWDRILVRAVKGLISRAGMVSICPLLWQRDVKLQQTNKQTFTDLHQIGPSDASHHSLGWVWRWVHRFTHNLNLGSVSTWITLTYILPPVPNRNEWKLCQFLHVVYYMPIIIHVSQIFRVAGDPRPYSLACYRVFSIRHMYTAWSVIMVFSVSDVCIQHDQLLWCFPYQTYVYSMTQLLWCFEYQTYVYCMIS